MSRIAWSVAFCTSASSRFCVVLADRVIFQTLLQDVDAVAPDMADRDAGVLAVFVGDLDHFLASLLVIRESGCAGSPLDTGAEAQIGVANRLVDGPHHALVPDRTDRARGSGTLIVATWTSGIADHRPRREPAPADWRVARPVRRPPSSCFSV